MEIKPEGKEAFSLAAGLVAEPFWIVSKDF